MELTKRCYVCKQDKDRNEFAKANKARDGLQSSCKQCSNLRHQRLRDERRPNRVRQGAYYILPEQKRCPKCGRTLPIDHFALREDGRRPVARCRECIQKVHQEWSDRNPHASRYRNLKVKYGITREEYEELEKKQQGLCGICGKPERSNRSKYLSVDHNHTTGKVRGLLCFACNTALGKMEEDLERMQRMIQWVQNR